MSLFNKLFKKQKSPAVDSYFKMLNGYVPVFSSWDGRIYESELCRTAIDTIARNASKLQVTFSGPAKKSLKNKMLIAPNSWQTWSQFLYRTTTILYARNTAFIVPIFDEYDNMTGVYTLAPNRWELVSVDGEPWLRFHFDNAQNVAIELYNVGIVTRYQYESDFFGEDNTALKDTMNLIKIQRQGIEEGVRNASSYRFSAKVNNFSFNSDLAEERKRFNDLNFSKGGGGLLLFPNTYDDIKQLSSDSYTINAAQLQIIQNNVYNYFGVNENVIQNKAYGDNWIAFYEGCIEPLAIQLSEVMSTLIFSERERVVGNAVLFTSNRLQYTTTTEKLNISANMLDRGVFTINQVLELWNLPPVEGGDERIIRGEYYNTTDKIDEEGSDDELKDNGQDS